jgi:fibro-slime domain-containing protein
VKKLAIACAGVVGVLVSTPAAAAYTLSVQYFSVTPGGDFGTQCCSTVTNLVQSTLGPNGLPVYNSSYGGPFTLTDLNANGELTWWSPAFNGRVTATGAGVVSTPVSDNTFFVPNGNGAGNGNAFLTAIFSGVITLAGPQTVTFSFGGDDDMFLFVDGQSVGQLGGVHGFTTATPTTSVLSAGNHTFTAFYADRAQTQAATYFNIVTEGITVTPSVPEPATWAMMLLGFGGIGLAIRRRRKTDDRFLHVA